MAVYGDSAGPSASSAASAEGPYKELSEEANLKLGFCVLQKQEFNLDIREGYFFTEPHRAREIRSEQPLSPTKPNDADTQNTGIAQELSADFVTEVVNGFMPPNAPWAEQKPGMYVTADMAEEVTTAIKDQDKTIFDAIRASNLYEALPLSFRPDISIGTAALWIQDLRPSENIIVQAVPLHELEINVGPFGGIDDRFVVRHTKHRHIRAVMGETVYAAAVENCKKCGIDFEKEYSDPKKQNQSCIIRWGYWRKWDRLDDVVWQHVVMIDKMVIYEVKLFGAGSCPLLVIRFNPLPEWAFGIGPAISALPDLRQMDELQAIMVSHVGKAANPPMGYPDDSMSQIAGGVEDGMYYPVRPGSEKAITPLVQVGNMEPAVYEWDSMEKRLRRRFYLDYPQQRGDTPPTATQWLDEMQLALRRFGTPGATFWREGPAEIFLRFKFILLQRQFIKPVLYKGGPNNGKAVSLEPMNPASRAAEMQEVMEATRFLQIMMPMFPEESKLMIDGGKTMAAAAQKMRVTGIIKFRSEKDQKTAIGAISQLMGGQQPGAPNGAAPPDNGAGMIQ